MKSEKRSLKAIIHASELITGRGIRLKDGRNIVDEDLGIISDGAIVYSKNDIEWVGATNDLPRSYKSLPITNLKSKRAVIPGMIDCHTHLVFAGNRSQEFSERCAGLSYAEIAKKGGGILSTVNATRKASVRELETLAMDRIQEMARHGVKTIEIKSGYGLSVDAELKILKVIRKLKSKFPRLTLVPTFLGAHAFPASPKPQSMARREYMKDLLEVMLPQIAKDKLAESCDVFVDEGYFTPAEGRDILQKAQRLGMKLRIHADELALTEATQLGVELQALSVDHLLRISDEGVQKLAQSNTVAVLLPGTAFYLKAAYAPARKLIQAGACVAIATDYNPGTCVNLSLPSVLTIAALYLGMSRAELFASVTYNAAKALNKHLRKGTLDKGFDPDFTVLPFPKFEETYYHFGWPANWVAQ